MKTIIQEETEERRILVIIWYLSITFKGLSSILFSLITLQIILFKLNWTELNWIRYDILTHLYKFVA